MSARRPVWGRGGLVGPVAAAVLAAGCSLTEQASVTPSDDAYSQAPHGVYGELGAREVAADQSQVAGQHADRRIATARTEALSRVTDTFAERELAPEHRGAVWAARSRLRELIELEAGTVAPTLTAEAREALECWMRALEEGTAPERAAACREALGRRLYALETAIGLRPDTYAVYFDSARATPNRLGRLITRKIAADAVHDFVTEFGIVGHTDLAGDAAGNQTLSMHRAGVTAATMRPLLPDGGAGLDKRWSGETEPAVPTADGVANPDNRRVEITPRP